MTTVGKLYGRAFGRIGISWSRRWRYKRLSRFCQAKLIKFSAVFLKTPPTFSVNVLASLGKRRKILVFDEECMLRRQ